MALATSSPIIVALDLPDLVEAGKMATLLKAHVAGFKVGLEILNSCGAPQVIDSLKNVPLFVDVKLHDIPQTVLKSCQALAAKGVWMINVHATGGREMMEAAREGAIAGARKDGSKVPLVLAVTILTSLNKSLLEEVGPPSLSSIQERVVALARLAKSCGLDGVVASSQEAAAIREACGTDFKIVTPGIRPDWAAANDQKRSLTPKEALAAGSDYLVIGRPITSPPADIGTPLQAIQRIIEELT